MKKPSYEDKIELIDRYIKRPMAMGDPPVLHAIKSDVVKVTSKGVKKGAEIPVDGAEHNVSDGKKQDHSLYNRAMGRYREFLKERDSYLDMTGRKAIINSDAMKGILKFIHDFARSNGKPCDDDSVFRGLEFMFNHWDRLNDYLRNRIQLRDIHDKIEEILPKIKNGADKKTSAKDDLQRHKQSLTKQ